MPISEGRVSVTDRGFQFADGVYEVIRVYNGRPFQLTPHLERLDASLRHIELSPPMTLDEMAAVCHEVIRRSGEKECALYVQITRGAAPRLHKFPDPSQVRPTVVVYNMKVNYVEPEQRRRGVRVITHPDIRWKMCHVKSIALLPNVLLKNRALARGAFEALLYDEHGLVAEGAASNAYCISNDVLYSAPGGPRILPGVTKSVVLEEARALGMTVVEDYQTVDFFKKADEVFLTSTTMEVMPVVQVDDSPIGGGAETGPWTWRLHEAYQRRIQRECRAENAGTDNDQPRLPV
ncbi:MAG: D-amino-acid transaminase [Candidatus Sumerlaeia bacterium]